MKAIRCIKTSENTSLVTQSHIPQDLNTQKINNLRDFRFSQPGYLKKERYQMLMSQDSATGWTMRGSSAGGDEIFRTLPDRPWSPSSLLYNGYRVSVPGVKRSRLGANSVPSSANVTVELNFCFPSGPM